MAETPAARRARARAIVRRLERAYPDAELELRWRTPLELLVATILAAQCTDARVNVVTADLFLRYRAARDYARVRPAAFEREIFSTGFYKAKTRAIQGMAQALVERHGGEVPRTMEALTDLPGVGRKTASVVLGHAFGVPAIAVDTHLFRVSRRLALATAEEPDEVHDQVADSVPRAGWTRASTLLTIHGRRTCLARRPECPRCPVMRLCPWPGKTPSGPDPAPRGRQKAPKQAPRGRKG
jgi:endonuclease-3